MTRRSPDPELQEDPERALDRFPQVLEDQDDVLQGLQAVAFGLLHGVVAPARAEAVRKVLETAGKTIAMRDTIKANSTRPQLTQHIQVAALVSATNQHHGAAPRVIEQDDFLDALGPLEAEAVPFRLSEPVPVAEPAQPPAPRPPAANRQRVDAGRSEVQAGRSALLASLQRST